MARIRTVKPEFWTDEDIASLSEPARLLAIGLLNHSDDEGYFKANHLLIKAAVFPLCEPSMTIHELLTELSVIGYIETCTGLDKKQYGRVVSFSKHQKVNRPNKSKIKELCTFTDNSVIDQCDVSEQSRSCNEQITDGSVTEQGTGNREQGTGSSEHDSGYAFCGEVIKLSQQDYDKWLSLFPNINLKAELERFDLEMKHDKPKNWFMTVSAKLNYQNKNSKPNNVGKMSAHEELMRGML